MYGSSPTSTAPAPPSRSPPRSCRPGTDPARGQQARPPSPHLQLRRDDGSEITLLIADSEQALRDVQKAVMTTELLPGEDPALLTGPDRIELYPVVEVHEVTATSPT